MSRVLAAANDKEDRPDLGEPRDIREPDTDHGQPGHKGVCCGQCARLSVSQVQAAPTGGDHWQNKQIEWQESCDKIFRIFDDAVADHFPDHLPVNCEACPTPPDLPVKPLPPVERSIAQAARPS